MQGAFEGMEYFQENVLFYLLKAFGGTWRNIHTKTLNRLQLAMLDFDFKIQQKKGIEMPADYLLSTPVEALSAVNVINEDLPNMQRNCKQTNDIIIYICAIRIFNFKSFNCRIKKKKLFTTSTSFIQGFGKLNKILYTTTGQESVQNPIHKSTTTNI